MEESAYTPMTQEFAECLRTFHEYVLHFYELWNEIISWDDETINQKSRGRIAFVSNDTLVDLAYNLSQISALVTNLVHDAQVVKKK